MSAARLTAVRAVLDCIELHDLHLMDVLDSLFWGDTALIDDPRLRGVRTSFTHDSRLPGLLRRLCRPPRTGKAHTKAVAGASGALDDFAFEYVYDLCLAELRSYEPTAAFDSDDIDVASIKNITLADIMGDVTTHTPRLYGILCNLMQTSRQLAENSDKRPDTLAVVVINMITYSRSWQRSKMQKLNAVFFKAAGVPTRVFDLLQSFGLSMSSSWVAKFFDGLCVASERRMREVVWNRPWFGLYDNLRFNIHSDSQRIYNQSLGVNCTALTVVVVPLEFLKALIDRGLNMKQLLEIRLQDPAKAPYITWKDFTRHTERVSLHNFAVDRVMSVLWALPELSQCSHRGHASLAPPAPVQQLAPRKVVYHMLGTVPIDEVSYEGNDLVIDEFMKQTGSPTPY